MVLVKYTLLTSPSVHSIIVSVFCLCSRPATKIRERRMLDEEATRGWRIFDSSLAFHDHWKDTGLRQTDDSARAEAYRVAV